MKRGGRPSKWTRVQENPVSLRSRWLQKSRVERWRTTDSALGLIKNQKVKQMGGTQSEIGSKHARGVDNKVMLYTRRRERERCQHSSEISIFFPVLFLFFRSLIVLLYGSNSYMKKGWLSLSCLTKKLCCATAKKPVCHLMTDADRSSWHFHSFQAFRSR